MFRRPTRPARSLAFLTAILSVPSLCIASPQKPKHPPVHQMKGQGQIAGGDGQFGTVYSLKSGFNFEILSAYYTADPF